MSWGAVKLGKIAPAKALKAPDMSQKDTVWQLNLDAVESQTGLVREKYLAPFSEAGSSTHWFDDTHVLYSKLRPYLNKVVLPDGVGLATTELVPMLPDAKRLDRKYLTYYLRSKGFVDWISAQVAGAKMPRVSMKVFWEHEIPLPHPDDPEKSLKEQKRIAAILDKVDGIRRKRQQAIQLADEFLRSVFLDMFGDPVTNPKGWELGGFKNISTINPKSEKYADTLEVSFVPMPRVSESSHVLDLTEIRSYESVKKGFTAFKEDDVLFAKITPCMENGKAAIATNLKNGVGFGSTEFHVFRPKNKQYSAFIYTLIHLPIFRKLAASNFSGAVGHKRVPKDYLDGFKLYLPPEELIQDYCAIFKAAHDAKERVIDSISSIEQIFNSLSQKAFKGEL